MSSRKNKYDPATRDKLQQVTDEEWQDALIRVLHYAENKTKYLSLLDYRIAGEELLQEAIARAYGVGTGKFDNNTYRNWNKDQDPSIIDFLISVINSMIDHILKEHRGKKFLPTTGEDSFQTQQVENLIQQQSSPETPETAMINDERARELDIYLDKISHADEEIGMLLLAVDAGYIKPADQAEEIGYDSKKIYNIRKRLGRKLNAFFDKVDK